MATNYFLKNNDLKIGVSSLGGELISLIDKKTNFEYIWQGKKGIWKDHCYNIFPICGRIKDDTYSLNGNNYVLPLHGFALWKEFQLENRSDNSLTLSFQYDEETLKLYPFKFRFSVNYELVGRRLNVSYIVENLDNQKIFFSCGAHPGINLNIDHEHPFDSYYIDLGRKGYSQLMLDDSRLIASKKKRYSSLIRLKRSNFTKSACMYTINREQILLCNKRDGVIVKMTMQDFPNLVLWTTKKAKLICLEPWQTLTMFRDETNDISKRKGFSKLNKKEIVTKKWSMEV